MEGDDGRGPDVTSPLAFLLLVAEMHLVFASTEGEEGGRERRRGEEGGERGREEGGEGEDSLAVCWVRGGV
jgi:hypothetical protein